MRKLKKVCMYLLAGTVLLSTIHTGENCQFTAGETLNFLTGGVADTIQIPIADSDMEKIGATMPYTRYDSKAAVLGGGAVLAESSDFAKTNLASQA